MLVNLFKNSLTTIASLMYANKAIQISKRLKSVDGFIMEFALLQILAKNEPLTAKRMKHSANE